VFSALVNKNSSLQSQFWSKKTVANTEIWRIFALEPIVVRIFARWAMEAKNGNEEESRQKDRCPQAGSQEAGRQESTRHKEEIAIH
jgi:hypothetical protein